MDFDAVLPFMLPLECTVQRKVAYRLRLAREAVTCLSTGEPISPHLSRMIERLSLRPELSSGNYGVIQGPTRTLVGDLQSSYLRDVRRVYYRRQLIHGVLEGVCERPRIQRAIRVISAFLLFDDDVVDLDDDLRNGKQTLLTQFLDENTARDAIAQMCMLITSVDMSRLPLLEGFRDALNDTYRTRGDL